MSARKLHDGGEVVVLGDIDDDTLKAAVTVMRDEYRRLGLDKQPVMVGQSEDDILEAHRHMERIRRLSNG